MSLKYAVVFENAASNWAAYVPDLPGCVTTANTLSEAEANIPEAIEGRLRTLQEFGEAVPAPSSVAREIEVTSAAWDHRLRTWREGQPFQSQVTRSRSLNHWAGMALDRVEAGQEFDVERLDAGQYRLVRRTAPPDEGAIGILILPKGKMRASRPYGGHEEPHWFRESRRSDHQPLL
jgi:predicted RNase H-like HicB family nuclease